MAAKNVFFYIKTKYLYKFNAKRRDFFIVLFLSLARKKKIPKRKGPVCTSGAAPDDFQSKGQKLATLKQSVLLHA